MHGSRRSHTPIRHHLYHFVFLCRPLDGGTLVQTPSHVNEVLAVDWFAKNALPADLDPGHASRIPEAYRLWHGDERAYFD